MAATSHDFWLKNLTPRVWKNLHMGVYLAYGLLVAHVALGLVQGEASPAFVLALALGVVGLTSLHLLAAARESRRDRPRGSGAGGAHPVSDSWIDVCAVEDIPLNRARTVCLPRGQGDGKPERVALFRHGNGISAVSNVCRHQGGPLGEGKIVDGCITCPWHGYQYRPGDGCAPPPFDDKVATYRVRVVPGPASGRVEIDPRALPPGTPVAPAPAACEESVS